MGYLIEGFGDDWQPPGVSWGAGVLVFGSDPKKACK